jgi:hypothetical protein
LRHREGGANIGPNTENTLPRSPATAESMTSEAQEQFIRQKLGILLAGVILEA